MGYQTDLELVIEQGDITVEQMFSELLKSDSENKLLSLFGESGGDLTSVNGIGEFESNIKELSKKYPEVVFALYGRGEDMFDDWVNYYKNGLVQEGTSEIIYTPFDEAKLTDNVNQ